MARKDVGEDDLRAVAWCLNEPVAAEDPLDLSISVRGGEETNEDFLSSGE